MLLIEFIWFQIKRYRTEYSNEINGSGKVINRMGDLLDVYQCIVDSNMRTTSLKRICFITCFIQTCLIFQVFLI